MRSGLLFGIVLSAFVVLDQGVKAWSRGRADGVEGYVFGAPWPGVFELKLAYNHGIAFGMFQGGGQWFAPVAVIIAGVAGWHAWRTPYAQKWMILTLGMLAAGAIGNLIDRLWLGKVTDMFWFRLINFPVFNVADACITVSAILLAIMSLRQDILARREVMATDSAE
ncbi:MAG: signal peptidase II [Chthonomonas sp.]|nr:signal peptidase II [Chthonomonas sp.]